MTKLATINPQNQEKTQSFAGEYVLEGWEGLVSLILSSNH